MEVNGLQNWAPMLSMTKPHTNNMNKTLLSIIGETKSLLFTF